MSRLILRSPKRYSTTFSATETPIVEDGGWRRGATEGGLWLDPLTAAGIARASAFNDPPNTPYNDSIAIRTGFAPRHAAECVLEVAGGYTPGASHESENLVGFTIANGVAMGLENTYGLTVSYVEVVWWKGGSGAFELFDQFEVGGFALADAMRAELDGDNLRHYKNGTLVHTTTGVTALGLPAGNPGIGFWCRPGNTLASYGMTSWNARDL